MWEQKESLFQPSFLLQAFHNGDNSLSVAFELKKVNRNPPTIMHKILFDNLDLLEPVEMLNVFVKS